MKAAGGHSLSSRGKSPAPGLLMTTLSSCIKLNPEVVETMHNNKLHQKHLVGVHMYISEHIEV